MTLVWQLINMYMLNCLRKAQHMFYTFYHILSSLDNEMEQVIEILPRGRVNGLFIL